ncbi:MAG: hypothetical protein AB9844_12550 [Clostridiaceae bacterium]
MENNAVFSDDKVVDLEEYKKSPLHKQRQEEQSTKVKPAKAVTAKKNDKRKKFNIMKPGKKGNKNKFQYSFKGEMTAHSPKFHIAAFLIMLAIAAAICFGIASFVNYNNGQNILDTTSLIQMLIYC